MKSFTFLLTALFALVFGQTAFAQLDVKPSDDHVQYKYYVKVLPGNRVKGTVGTEKSTMSCSSGTDVQFIFKTASTGNGKYTMYATNIIKDSEGSFILAPVTIYSPSYNSVSGVGTDYNISNNADETAAEFDLRVVRCERPDAVLNRYALQIRLRRASGTYPQSALSSWKENSGKIQYVTGDPTGGWFLWVVEAAAPAPMVFANATPGTLATYSTALDATIPEGVRAYVAKSSEVGDDGIELEQITDYIPAGVGVILQQTGTAQYYTPSTPESTSGDAPKSALIATSKAEGSVTNYTTSSGNITVTDYAAAVTESSTGSIVVANATNIYGLSTSSGNFCHFSEEGDITMPAYKAYLNATTADGTIKLKFPDGSTTSINGVNVGPLVTTAPIYDLSGRRVITPTKGNIYIQSGKKFVAD